MRPGKRERLLARIRQHNREQVAIRASLVPDDGSRMRLACHRTMPIGGRVNTCGYVNSQAYRLGKPV